MKTGYKKILFIEILFSIILFFYNFVFKINSYGIVIFLNIVILLLTIYLLGFEKDRFRYKTDIFLTTIIYSISFLILCYLLSFPIGYLKTSYSLKFINIIKNIFPIILIILLSEINRYCLVTKSKGFKFGIIFATILMCFIDIYFKIDILRSGNIQKIIECICGSIIPSVFKNILLTYITYNVGYKVPILYRLIFEVTDYIFPIFPGFGSYIQSILDIIFPFVLFIKFRNMFNKEKKINIDVRKNNIFSKISLVFSIIFMAIVVALNSGLFKYYSVAVGSNSMKKYINMGDVVIVKKYNQNQVEKLKEGEILFFEKNGKLVLHRIIEKMQNNNIYYFQTKGDNNAAKDEYIVNQHEVKGKIVMRIRYIGWPAVWLSELLNRR